MVHIFGGRSGDGGSRTAGQKVTAVYLFLILLCLPLVMNDYYFNIMETKYAFFMITSLVYVFLELALWIYGGRSVLPFTPLKPLRVADIGIALFVLIYLVGALLSGDRGVWLGQTARYQGVVTVFVYALVYLCIARNFCFPLFSYIGLAAGLSIACLLGLLNDFGVDLLGLARSLDYSRRWQFVSTLGNTNFYSAYLGALLPVPLTVWCFARKRAWRIVSGLALLFGFCGMLPTSSESFVLALLMALWLLPPFLLHEPRALRRYLIALIAMALTLGFVRLIMSRFATTYYLSFSLRLLSHPAAVAAIVLVSGALLLFLRNKEAPLRGRRAYFLVSLALLALGIAFFILRNTALLGLSFGKADRFLLLNDEWGTNRGGIWAYCLRMFEEFSPFQKLFGGGPSCLFQYDLKHPLFPDAYVDNAHNEYLQYLLTAGILGLGGYLTFLYGTASAALRRAAGSPMTLAFIAGALAYAAQAVVNIAQPISTPFLFLLLGMAAGCAIEPETAGDNI